jgi:hypothetical protein
MEVKAILYGVDHEPLELSNSTGGSDGDDVGDVVRITLQEN